MKFAILLLLVSFIALSWGWTETHNGRPCCTSDIEMKIRYWRNHYDSTRYFTCTEKGKPGDWSRCEEAHLFQPKLLKCVHHTKWYHEPNVDPPSMCL